MYDMVTPVYERLGIEPMKIPPGSNPMQQQQQPYVCEYVVLREGSPGASVMKCPNMVYPKLAGTFFVLKCVTHPETMYRIQIDVAKYDHSTIVLALHAKYGDGVP